MPRRHLRKILACQAMGSKHLQHTDHRAATLHACRDRLTFGNKAPDRRFLGRVPGLTSEEQYVKVTEIRKDTKTNKKTSNRKIFRLSATTSRSRCTSFFLFSFSSLAVRILLSKNDRELTRSGKPAFGSV